ncbi:unnamed protein product, partial [Effrenium voratum]
MSALSDLRLEQRGPTQLLLLLQAARLRAGRPRAAAELGVELERLLLRRLWRLASDRAEFRELCD